MTPEQRETLRGCYLVALRSCLHTRSIMQRQLVELVNIRGTTGWSKRHLELRLAEEASKELDPWDHADKKPRENWSWVPMGARAFIDATGMDRPPMAHGGQRPEGERKAKPILAPPFAVIPHPDHKGQWVVTHWSVLVVGCECSSAKGELCQDPGTGRYWSTTHWKRRNAVNRAHLVDLLRDRDIRFPMAAEWAGHLGEEVV